jgi:magnesium transporter
MFGFFMTSLKRLNDILLHRIKNIPKEHFDLELLEDVEIELRQARNYNIYSDILTGTMDAYASVISNNMNTIMLNDFNFDYFDDSHLDCQFIQMNVLNI